MKWLDQYVYHSFAHYFQVEYDLAASSVDNVRILSIERIEQSATPRCMAWHPPLNKEHFIVTANDQVTLSIST